jgi:two-component system, HptB-dependent secretion and biofilm response regulator
MPVRDKPLILAVDDVPENIDVLKSILTSEYAMSAAVNGPLALKIAEKQLPDLILLDVMMPGMDGHQVLRRLKENEATRSIPVMFVSALGEEENELQGLELGAGGYVAKPIPPKILKARISTHLTLLRIRRELDDKNRRLEQERAFLEDVVLRMSQDSHFDASRLKVLHRLVDKTGGDLVLSAFRPNGRRHLLVGDFTGHGLPAALGGILVSHLFYDLTARDSDAEQVVAEINRVLHAQLPSNIYMAAQLVELAADGRAMRVWNAGLPDCLVLRGDGQWLHLASSLLPLGIIGDIEGTPTASLPLVPGDHCYAFTDGLTEAENRAGEQFGMTRLKETLLRYRDAGDLRGLEQDHQEFVAGQPLLDDLTLVELIG